MRDLDNIHTSQAQYFNVSNSCNINRPRLDSLSLRYPGILHHLILLRQEGGQLASLPQSLLDIKHG